MTRWLTRRRVAVAVVAMAVVSAGAWQAFGRAVVPDEPTEEVIRGNYADVIEVRGDVRPVRSTLVAAPSNSGELVIMKIARNGTVVKKGDIVAEFDALTMRRTIIDKQSDLRSRTAELEQAKAQSRITLEERATAVRRATFDVTKAKLGIIDDIVIAPIEAERARLAVADAQQRLKEAEAAEAAAKATVTSDLESRGRGIEKVRMDLQRAENAVKALLAIAPADGVVNILPNYRAGGAEHRPGDKTYAGATILELPDLTSVFLIARIDESERGPLRPGLSAAIRADAIPDRDYRATVTEVSLLARVDYMNWPPQKLFDLKLSFGDPDDRLRPGMSAVARMTVGELKDVLLVPATVVFTEDGASVVYRLGRRGFSAVPVNVIRRGREQAVIEGAIAPGDRVAKTNPNEKTGAGRK